MVLNWLEEKVIDVPSNKFFYKVLKFILKGGKELTYKELYIFYTHVYNMKNKDEDKIKENAAKLVKNIYLYNNNGQ